MGKNTLDQFVDRDNSTLSGKKWLSAQEPNLPIQWHHSWHHYTNSLSASHIIMLDHEDDLIWVHPPRGSYTPKEGHRFIYADHEPKAFS